MDLSAVARALSGNYDTQLSPLEEAKYLAWKQQAAPRDSGADYDLRGAYQVGEGTNGRGHWTDRFKKPSHPTFSAESQYSAPGTQGGTWSGNAFMPSRDMMSQPGFMEMLKKYLAQQEPGVQALDPYYVGQ